MSLTDDYALLVDEARRLAKSVPQPVIEVLVDALHDFDADDWITSRNRALQRIAQPGYRSEAGRFFDVWNALPSKVSPQCAALCLLTAATSDKAQRGGQTIELVWTGPDANCIPLRRTEQVLLQVIDSAKERLLVVSYAVHNIPDICDALVKATERGVVTTIIIETPNRLEGSNNFDTVRALGSAVAKSCSVYFWPEGKREKSPAGKVGILHVKCAVADGSRLFLSSANLTEYALSTNMELGILITGGTAPEQVERQFDRFMQSGVFRKI
jgi:phosphatidylserine/phosphatidylglycerophosphate/cardiolipin synthase-like enzyme